MDRGPPTATLCTMMVARVLVSAVALCFAASCGDPCAEPSYAGAATDEVWRVMLDARATATSAGDVAVFEAPVADAVVAAGTPPTFSWSSPLKLASNTTHHPSPAWTPRPRGIVDDLFALVIPAARAHLPPITSDLYFLEVDVPGQSCPVAGLTTELSFTFPSEAWSTIAAGGGPRTARLLSAFVTQNRVTEGAFVAAPVTFTIE